MNVTFTNLGTVVVPLASSDGDGLVLPLDPGSPVTVDNTDVVVASVGDNPTFREEVEDALKSIATAFVRLVMFWRDHQAEDPPHLVHVSLINHGPNPLRVLLGSNTNEVEVAQNSTYIARAEEYVEVRELGV